ncbi:hypothetical protein PGT21_011962 [Puccinia graminis f. sp. tritici]|uniref:Uncharacterized protein n=1 Tax=Puccinia graminis f. sp. tritici TaxID=56615 RepID=A0A5B0MBT2_PUCGR|nr:hypothetical protein PGT21_011962 [Puccinia graminis f. sp. tritici]
MVRLFLAATFLVETLYAVQCLSLAHEPRPQIYHRYRASMRAESLTARNLAPGPPKSAAGTPEKLMRSPSPLSEQIPAAPLLQKGSKINHKGTHQQARKIGVRIRKKRGLGNRKDLIETEMMKKIKGKMKEVQQSNEHHKLLLDGAGSRNERPTSLLGGDGSREALQRSPLDRDGSQEAPHGSSSSRDGSRESLQRSLLGGVGSRSVRFVGESSTALQGIARSQWRAAATRIKAIQAFTEDGSGRKIMQKVGQVLGEAEHVSLSTADRVATLLDFFARKIGHVFEILEIEEILERGELWALWCVARAISEGGEILKFD